MPFTYFILLRFLSALCNATTKSCPLILNSLPTFTFCPPPCPIIPFSLSSGAITSGFALLPGYSPINPIVGPDTIPPFANFGTEANCDFTSPTIPAISAGNTIGATGPASNDPADAPAIAFATDTDNAAPTASKAAPKKDAVNDPRAPSPNPKDATILLPNSEKAPDN